MEQHPIPRQITTFEFKLIGFMTLKQFLYLIIFIPLGFITYFLFPIPILNIFLAFIVGVLGVVFAFVPIMDRPAEIWLKNLYKRLTSPTQYFYKKNNPPIYFFKDLFFINDPHRVMAHIESQEKLNAYLLKQKSTTPNSYQQKKASINNLFFQKTSQTFKKQGKTNQTKNTNQQVAGVKKPFLTGVVRNHKLIPLPGIMIYIKDKDQKPVRLLKTNPNGVFATFNPLMPGDYFFEIRDPNNNYFFDILKINIEQKVDKPIEIFSKELI